MQLDKLLTNSTSTNELLKDRQGSSKVEESSFQQALNKATAEGEDQKIREAAQQFEALFVYQMMEKMRSTVPTNDFWGDSSGVKIFQSMLDEEMSNNISKAEGIGLAKMLYDQLKPKGNVVKLQDAE